MRFPLEIQLQSSSWLRALLASFHCLVVVAFVKVAWHALPLAVVAMLVLGLAGSAVLSDRAERRKSGLALMLDESGLLTIFPGEAVTATMQSGCADQGWAVWLRWREPESGAGSRSGAMMLVPGNLSPDDWRCLRIWLRHKASVGAAA